jgi:hypothetical protein
VCEAFEDSTFEAGVFDLVVTMYPALRHHDDIRTKSYHRCKGCFAVAHLAHDLDSTSAEGFGEACPE